MRTPVLLAPLALLICNLLLLPSLVWAAEDASSYQLIWTIALEPGNDWAEITLEVEDGRPLRDVRFNYDPQRFGDFEASGRLDIDEIAHSVHWEPARENASLSYRARITRERANQNQDLAYDALMTDEWALFRGDRLIPGMRVTTRQGMSAETVLRFELPDGWGATTGWPRDQSQRAQPRYFVDDPDRRFDRPTGWMLAGRFGSRRDRVGDTEFTIAAPRDSAADRGSWLTLAGLVWNELEEAFGTVPPKILMVSGDDPLWRGGLSGPNSFYFHSSRRAVSENGTSPLLHELVHVVTRISGGERDDWIAEGLAEYYGIELVYRAGGMSERRRGEIMQRLDDWSGSVSRLRGERSSGPVTARAVLLFDELDRETRTLTKGRENLDAVTRLLMAQRRVSLADLRRAFREVSGADSVLLADLQ